MPIVDLRLQRLKARARIFAKDEEAGCLGGSLSAAELESGRPLLHRQKTT
jgi:hypothetical protein